MRDEGPQAGIVKHCFVTAGVRSVPLRHASNTAGAARRRLDGFRVILFQQTGGFPGHR
jgi:hypothetical protein